MIAPKHAHALPIHALTQAYSEAFFDDADSETKAIVEGDALMLHYKTHPKTNFKPRTLNVLNIFETPATLEFLLRYFVLLS